MENKKSLFPGMQELLPYLVAIALFVLLTIIYVSPLLEGKRLLQPDIVNYQGMAKEIVDYREQTGEEALWTNSMFGGMPAFQISVKWAHNIANVFHKIMTLWLPRPADMIFLYFAGFFIFLLLLRVSPWIALAGAVGFAFSSYHFIIIEAGHNSKAVAIAYMAPVLASIIYTFRGNRLTGGLLFAIFMGLQLFANHFQITYYLAWVVLLYGLFEFYEHMRQGRMAHFLKGAMVLVAALVIAAGINIGNFWATYSYSSETMRGGSELTIGDREPSSGLQKDYITNWSYGVGETFSLLIPNAKGGATGALGDNTKAMSQVDQQFRSFVGQQNHYWGDQPFTSGPVYVGAVVLFFFFLGIFFVKGPLKWALLLATILSIMLAWGKNFMPLTDFFIDFVPGYNKFRAVSMTLIIAEFTIPALAFLGMHHLYKNPELLSYKSKEFLTALGFTAGISFIFYLLPTTFFSFASQMESDFFASQSAENPQAAAQIRLFLSSLEDARVAIFKADALRSMGFALITAAMVLLFAFKKIKGPVFVLMIVALIILDMWPVNKRYLNDSNFQTRRLVENPYQPTQANLQILQDNDPHFRVYNRTVNTFNETSTSWFHKSIGGYHGAKLQRYQDLIDFHIVEDNIEVLNMLNTRYVIVPGENRQPEVMRNPGALGNAWFVSQVRTVENADEEILALDMMDPGTAAVLDKRYASFVDGRNFQPDTLASIKLTEYRPNRLRYSYQSKTEQVAVFSEIYYPDGWTAKLNGEPAKYFRVNYLLRAMVIPAGSGEIEFVFKPAAYYTGGKIAWSFSALILALIALYVWSKVKRYRKDPADKILES
jgi:hypothetical protein